MTYTERLRILNISSIQRRYDRYKILYVRKILKGLVPNPGISIRRGEDQRGGLTLEVPRKKPDSKLRLNSFIIKGLAIYNCLPPDLRLLEDNMEIFKTNLDQFLSLIPDNPRIDGGGCNELEERLKRWIWSLRSYFLNICVKFLR